MVTLLEGKKLQWCRRDVPTQNTEKYVMTKQKTNKNRNVMKVGSESYESILLCIDTYS